MPRLRRVSPDSPGWTRRRSGQGFSYADERGEPLASDQVGRLRALAIPPAWREVWICPLENGHLQAVGTDAAGRRQYLYHPAWRQRRDQLKYRRVARAAALLPAARRRVGRDLRQRGMPLERVCALAVRLLDEGYFRIGNDVYADAHGSFGLTTLLREHVRRQGEILRFRFTGKSGIEHEVTISDIQVVRVLQALRRRRDDSERLLAYRTSGGWAELTSTAVNTYLATLLDGEFTAKDFRTWHATVLAAESLALSPEPGDTKASRKRAIRAAVAEVASYLGNTPAVARSSYVDPRVFDRYESGTTINPALAQAHRGARGRTAAEAAVLELLAEG
ncbi:MAG: DNA topoisomerase IB [Propionibacteriaceae bacterium]|nr:DNA topoisomerase IB [Propionibacteriaceae bacterium]